MKKIITVMGETASGKTGFGIELAKYFDGEIISADSRQVYVGLDLASGKATKEEQAIVPHHLLDILPINVRYSSAQFKKDCEQKIEEIFARGKLPIIVGGTGYYVRSVTQGYSFKGGENKPCYEALNIVVSYPKDILHERILLRLDQRIQEGMIKEMQDLIKNGADPDFLISLGLECKYITKHLQGEYDFEQFRDILFTRIRQFAKRQRTWLRKEKNTLLLDLTDKTALERAKVAVKEFLK